VNIGCFLFEAFGISKDTAATLRTVEASTGSFVQIVNEQD
jgi:hypothetical protein